MMRLIFSVTVLFFFAAFSVVGQSAGGTSLSADDLLRRLDHNEVSSTSHSVGKITVEDRFGQKVTEFESWTIGQDKSMIAFTAGEEKGQKFLRLSDTTNDTIYISYPEADKPVKIQGTALRDSVAGSDFSYEDMAGDRGYSSRYEANIVGHESVDGTPCVVLELVAKRSGIAYPYLKIWIDEQDFSSRKIEKYSQNRRLLKSAEIQAVTTVSGKTIPTKILMVDHLKGKSQTVFDVSSIELEVKVDPKRLSLEELTW